MTETVGTEPISISAAIVTHAPAGIMQRQRIYFDPRSNPTQGARSQADKREAEFKRHEKKWKQDTQFFSSPSDKYLHPSYARIIGMGRPAASLILKSLKKDPADWFYALRAITGANPVTDGMAGDVTRMSEAWIKWGERQGLL